MVLGRWSAAALCRCRPGGEGTPGCMNQLIIHYAWLRMRMRMRMRSNDRRSTSILSQAKRRYFFLSFLPFYPVLFSYGLRPKLLISLRKETVAVQVHCIFRKRG